MNVPIFRMAELNLRHFMIATRLLLAFAGIVGQHTISAAQQPTLVDRIQARGDLGLSTLSFSPDGKLIALASTDGTVQLWDVATSNPKATLRPTKPLPKIFNSRIGVAALAFSPDGKTVASSGGYTSVTLWDMPSGNERQNFEEQDPVWKLAFVSEDKILALKTSPGDIKLWDVKAGRMKKNLTEIEPPWGIALSPDGKLFLVGTPEKTVKLLDVNTGKELVTLQERFEPNSRLGFSPDGRTIVSESKEYDQFRIWDVKTGKQMTRFGGLYAPVFRAEVSPNGKMLATCGVSESDEDIKLWDVASGKLKCVLADHIFRIHSLAFSPDSKTLASWGEDRSLRLWDLTGGPSRTMGPKERATLKGHADEVTDVRFSPDGKLLASIGRSEETIRLWDVAKGEMKAALEHRGQPCFLAFSPDAKTLVSKARTSKENQKVTLEKKIWDVIRAEEIDFFKEGIGQTTPESLFGPSFAFSADGKTLAALTENFGVTLWDPASGKEKGALEGRDKSKWAWCVKCMVFSPDAQTLLIGGAFVFGPGREGSNSEDPAILYDVSSKKEKGRIKWESHVAAFSPDGKTVALACYHDILLADVATGKRTGFLPGAHFRDITALAFSPDGRTLASGSNDRSARVWDVEFLKEKAWFRGHAARILAVAFSPDGRTMATGSADKTIKLWDVPQGRNWLK